MAFSDQMLIIILSIIIGILAAIVYSLRVLVLMERRVARVEMHLEKMAGTIIKEEFKIEKSVKKRKRR